VRTKKTISVPCMVTRASSLRLDGAVEGQREVGPGAMDAHRQEREQGSGDDGDEGEDEVEAARARGSVVKMVFIARELFAAASHALNSSCETTRRRGLHGGSGRVRRPGCRGWVVAGSGGRELEMAEHAGDGVLLEAHCRG